MDDRTEDLADLFRDVAGTDSVTEGQAADRGTLADHEDGPDRDRVRTVVERLQEGSDFETDLATETYCEILAAAAEGRSDAGIAADLECSADEVHAARLDCHFLRAADLDPPCDDADLADRDVDPERVAERCVCSKAAVRRYRRARDALAAVRRTSYRFRDELGEALTDGDLTEQLTRTVHEDGLDDATDDAETDVSL